MGEECRHFYYDENRRLPCLEDCKAHLGRRAKCLGPTLEDWCDYPLSRSPEVPALMPEPVRWCPGPGGCMFFSDNDYSCELRRQEKTLEYTYKYQTVEKRSAWDGKFSGKAIMIIGGIGLIIAIWLARTEGSDAFVVTANFIFCLIVFLVGYAFYKWQSNPWGIWDGNMEKTDRSLNTAKDFVQPALLAALISKEPNPEGTNYCQHYYYDLNNRLPCLPGCDSPNRLKAKCLRQGLDSGCKYPISRKPIIKMLMPKPVAWCPGPGGCEYFSEEAYLCELKSAGKACEHMFFMSDPKNYLLIGRSITAFGLLWAVGLSYLGGIVLGNLFAAGIFVITGVMISWIGWTIVKNSKWT